MPTLWYPYECLGEKHFRVMPDQYSENLEEIFHGAFASAPNERAAYLDQACDKNQSLRRAVESLLKSHEETGNFVDAPLIKQRLRC